MPVRRHCPPVPPRDQWPHQLCDCGQSSKGPRWNHTTQKWGFYRQCSRCINVRHRYKVDGWPDLINRLGPPPSHCPICQRSSNRMVIDHDHATGRLRSWLCNECNVMVGMGAECPTILSNARDYVIKHKAMSTMEEICASLPLSPNVSLD